MLILQRGKYLHGSFRLVQYKTILLFHGLKTVTIGRGKKGVGGSVFIGGEGKSFVLLFSIRWGTLLCAVCDRRGKEKGNVGCVQPRVGLMGGGRRGCLFNLSEDSISRKGSLCSPRQQGLVPSYDYGGV